MQVPEDGGGRCEMLSSRRDTLSESSDHSSCGDLHRGYRRSRYPDLAIDREDL